MDANVKTQTPVTFEAEKIYTLKDAKDLLKKNKGPLGGLRFYAENAQGEKVEATVMANLSNRGKIQATLNCLVGGPTHIREISDWHQSLKSPSSARKAMAQAAKAVEGTVAEAQPSGEASDEPAAV